MGADLTMLDHPMRRVLNDEVHARPSDIVPTPSRITYVAHLSGDRRSGSGNRQPLADLLESLGGTAPKEDSNHLTINFGDLRLRFERHTEFCRYAFLRDAKGAEPFSYAPLEGVPVEWLESLQGDLLVAIQMHVAEIANEAIDTESLSTRYFSGNALTGGMIAGGQGAGLSDLRIHDDGFSRILLLNRRMPPAQTGRYVQRLLEIETYRMMALLALPMAQDLLPRLDLTEQELASIGDALMDTGLDEERALLQRLTKIAAGNQSWHATSDFRFTAAGAYYDLVLQRIQELREERISGLQTFEEMMTRRLTPAIKTTRAVARRQQSIVLRLARSTQLLSTRIDVERQLQNQSILESVNHRLKSQLRLQATVEGISVAAVTYYVVGLIRIIADGLQERGWPVDPGMVTAMSVPVVAGIVFYLVRRIRRRISDESDP